MEREKELEDEKGIGRGEEGKEMAPNSHHLNQPDPVRMIRPKSSNSVTHKPGEDD